VSGKIFGAAAHRRHILLRLPAGERGGGEAIIWRGNMTAAARRRNDSAAASRRATSATQRGGVGATTSGR